MDQPQRHARRRKGQTLAEFSLTLPILLLLGFGLIEFGRLFQSWVTIQNAAREATRYTTTGLFDENKYSLDGLLPCSADSADVGTMARTQVSDSGPLVDWFALDHVNGTLGPASLFATVYDGEKCDPGNVEHLERRKDILRLASIYDRARMGAGGLSLEPNRQNGSREDLESMFFDMWKLPVPRRDQPRYFNVVICSSRQFINGGPDPNQDSQKIANTISSRFVTVFDDETLQNQVPVEFQHGFPTPYCMLNERQPAHLRADGTSTDNAGLPWLDAGGPGDRVSIFITYNHPLITPLGLAEYVRMEARRSGVNESFRAARALNAVEGAPSGLAGIDTPTPLPPTDTATPSDTPTDTPVNSPTPTLTYTPTNAPFDCEELIVGQLSFFQQRVYIEIENRNFEPTTLERIELNWPTPVDYPGMYLAAMALNGVAHWSGERQVSPFDSNAHFSPAESSNFFAANRTVPGQYAVSIWEGLYMNAGFNLAAVLNPWDFHNTKFYFSNPGGGPACIRTYDYPPEDVPPSPEPPADATDTYTPDCASSSIRVEFVGFDSFGVVQLRVTNNRFQVAPLLGFNVSWPDPSSYNPSLYGVLTLRKISVGGVNADDFGTPDSQGVLVWRGRTDWGDGLGNGDREPATTHTEGSFWRTDYVFPPRSVTSLWIDFDGTSSTLPNAFGIGAWDFNGTWFDIGCGSTGGPGGGGGGGEDGRIHLVENPIPPPTNTPKPSNTPGPTFTPTATVPSPTPSNTWTPGPTPTPSNTPTPTLTQPPQPPTAPPTQIGGTSTARLATDVWDD